MNLCWTKIPWPIIWNYEFTINSHLDIPKNKKWSGKMMVHILNHVLVLLPNKRDIIHMVLAFFLMTKHICKVYINCCPPSSSIVRPCLKEYLLHENHYSLPTHFYVFFLNLNKKIIYFSLVNLYIKKISKHNKFESGYRYTLFTSYLLLMLKMSYFSNMKDEKVTMSFSRHGWM